MTSAFFSLGSNIGDRKKCVDSAVTELNEHPHIQLVTRSSYYETEPWGGVEQDSFLNICISVETALSAEGLLKFALSTETRLGRVRDQKWGPRIIDIDLLIFGKESHMSPHLTVPHPHIMDRAFVLIPLAEIAPDLEIKSTNVFEAAVTHPDKEGVIKLVWSVPEIRLATQT
ncbi:MAG: 2-amino-4-hydroxy-6-hydroxymethyldihydropteridine diphosphokinase [Cohaesibacteraceae bacterium]|nr:2-amino-4-hydroxy-6-hydroxymethyldihydropteridine diphosphokinase [Cohaesibacteraceae bacterium]